MKKMTYLRIAVFSPLRQHFDYLPLDDDSIRYQRGQRLLVPLGHREVVGILLAEVSETDVDPNKLKPINKLLDQEPIFSESLMEMLIWASEYYHYPLGEVFATALPIFLRKEKKINVNRSFDLSENNDPKSKPLILNSEQHIAVNTIIQNKTFKPYLLQGVTGSGKTEVYLQVIDAILKRGKQALVLVPEISLTPQTVARFQNRFRAPVVSLHSALTNRERYIAWWQAKNDKAKIIIGTRSSIFTELKYPGIIIVDEEHDHSFKQQSGFRYSARDLAVMRARYDNIPVVLGTATPSLETYFNAITQRYQLLTLNQRAGNALPPTIQLFNLCEKSMTAGIANELFDMLRQHLERKEQVLFFLNRRGFAPILMCHQCGWMMLCPHCDARLTLHFSSGRLHCHHCLYSRLPPRICQHCKQSELMPVGQGTEKLEQVAKEIFPDKNIVRVDRDTVSTKNKLQEKLDTINAGEADILIGTQMLAKGHHFPNLTLVVIVDADGALFSSDFRAVETMAQLLLQVSGRAGRAEKPGRVMIQTHHPEHPLLQLLVQQGYNAFLNQLLEERKMATLPPYSYLALLNADAKDRKKANDFLNQAKNSIQKNTEEALRILGPTPAVMERRAGRHHFQLLLQCEKRSVLQEALEKMVPLLKEIKITGGLRWSLDIDPISLQS